MVNLVGLDVNGDLSEVTEEKIHEYLDAYFDIARITPNLVAFVDDCGLLNRLPLNVPLSLIAGRPLVGRAVLGSIDRHGDTVAPDESLPELQALIGVARAWRRVLSVMNVVLPRVDPASIPGPIVIGLEEGESIEDALRKLAASEGDDED